MDRDLLLTQVSIYWFTRTITSSVRLYAEGGWLFGAPEVSSIPMAVSVGLARSRQAP